MSKWISDGVDSGLVKECTSGRDKLVIVLLKMARMWSEEMSRSDETVWKQAATYTHTEEGRT